VRVVIIEALVAIAVGGWLYRRELGIHGASHGPRSDPEPAEGGVRGRPFAIRFDLGRCTRWLRSLGWDELSRGRWVILSVTASLVAIGLTAGFVATASR